MHLSNSTFQSERIKDKEESELTTGQADGDVPTNEGATEVHPEERVSNIAGDETLVPHRILSADNPKRAKDAAPIANSPTLPLAFPARTLRPGQDEPSPPHLYFLWSPRWHILRHRGWK
ncbi:hypothetical protein BJ138DRAFT_1118760 [Hygrophoropsis aurantiaca]|uniref:Uncharacterized protein n=1 Tax=Hygrophoropsis aurantiaca TaxID=72124 RepID=A0ACB7ZVG8_9AGAM|nr:hypothetical protein BJ138DRAFT_1118760 [Hygrophoropsis aurantiaca]